MMSISKTYNFAVYFVVATVVFLTTAVAQAQRPPEPTATPAATPTPCAGGASRVCVCTVTSDGNPPTSMTVPGEPDANGSCAHLNGQDGQSDCTASCPPDNSEPSGR